MSRRRIFVFEPTRLNIENARTYGEFVYIFGSATSDHRASIWSPKFREQIIDRLTALAFDPEQDYILLAGNSVPLHIVVAALVAEYSSISAIAFNAQSRTYVPIELGDTAAVEE